MQARSECRRLLTSESEVEERAELIDGEDTTRKNRSGHDGTDRIGTPHQQARFRTRDFRTYRQCRAEACEYLVRIRQRPDDDETEDEPAQRHDVGSAEAVNTAHGAQHRKRRGDRIRAKEHPGNRNREEHRDALEPWHPCGRARRPNWAGGSQKMTGDEIEAMQSAPDHEGPTGAVP